MKSLTLSKSYCFFIIAALWSCITMAGGLNYSELKMKDYDEMMAEVKTRVQSAEKMSDNNIDGARTELQFALLFILSRPDSDNMVSKLVPLVRTPLKNIESYESVLKDLVERAIVTAKDKKTKPANGATSLIILENFMGELKPESKTNKEIKGLFALIRDAKIDPSTAVKTEMKMRAMMKTGLSPSDTAKKIIGAGK